MSDGGDGGGNTTLRSAMKLYEENGDPTSSLRECQRVWSSSSNTSSALTKSVDDNSNTDNVEKSAKEEDEEVPLSRRHNEAILSSLSSQQRQLRQRSRRVRPRPSSFDDDEEDGATNNNNIAAEKKNDDKKLASTGDNNNNNTEEEEEEEEEDLISLLRKMWTLSIQQVTTSTAAAAVFIEPQKYCNLFTSMAMDNNSNNNSNSGNSTINNEYEQQRLQLFTTSYNLSLAKYASGKYIEVLHILLVPLVTLMDVVSITTPIDSSSSSGDNNDNGGGEGMVLQFKEKDNNNNSSSSKKSSSKKNNKCTQLPLNSPIVKSLLSIMTRATFLLLDCILNTHVGNGRGLEPIEIITTNDDNVDGDDGGDKTKVKEGSVSVNDILDWIEDTILVYGRQQQQQPLDDEILKADEVKFKLHLYRSRVLLQGTRGCNDNKITLDGETRAKLARKELKNAMDIYQNKLCVVEDNSGGGGGGSSEGERKGGGGGGGGGSKRKQNQGGKGGYGGGGNNHNQQDTSETTSVSGSLVTSASDGLWKEGKGGVVARATFEGMPNNKQQQQQQSASSTSSKTPNVKVKKDNPGLHVRHESALYMKANLEFLRGNTTKSLKLCAEARAAGKKSRAGVDRGGEVQIRSEENGGFAAHDNAAAATSNANANTNTVSTKEEDLESQMANDYDEAIYYNNLAMVHQSAGKIHVALHYYSYAISYMENVQMPDDNFFWSDGVARPNVTPDILNNASLCAFQTHDYKRAYECMAQCVTLSPDIFGERARCWLRMAQSLIGMHTNQLPTGGNESVELSNEDAIDCNIGGEEDLRNISTNPFPRIIACLYKAQNLSNGLKVGEDVDVDVDSFEASTLSLAYAKLELHDAAGALEMCKLILGSDFVAASSVDEDQSNYTSESLRRRAMARLYACEAFLRIGDPNSASMIVESESSIQRVASNLSVPNSVQHDAYAQFVTRTTASGTTVPSTEK